MKLEDYFDFLEPTDIRVSGTRIGIESILYEYVHRCKTAEQIAQQFETVSIEQVYATILYYLHNCEHVSRYLAEWLEWGRRVRAEQQPVKSDFQDRLRQARSQRQSAGRIAS